MALPYDAYLVLASQRSGSTLLVEALADTKVAGNPQEFFQYFPGTSLPPQPREWFADVTDPDIIAALAPLKAGTVDTRTPEQWREDVLREGRSENGLWGGKLMWNQVPLFLARTRQGEASLPKAIRALLGDNVLFLHVFRPDVVPQAVSMWRAVQTQEWRHDPTRAADRPEAKYHGAAISHLARILKYQEYSWQRWFIEAGITPVEIPFATLTRDPQDTTAHVLSLLGLDPALAQDQHLTKQSDEQSHQWIERYRHDALRHGYTV